eukprot:403349846
MGPLMGNYTKKYISILFKREIFPFQDGGHIAIDWVNDIPQDLSEMAVEQSDPNTNNSFDKRPIVLVLPGLTSNNNEIYMQNILKEASKHGYQAVVINYRGGSNLELKSPKMYCAASTGDIREPLDYIYKKYCCDLTGKNFRKIFLIGNSMGGNIVANYLGEEGEIQQKYNEDLKINTQGQNQKYEIKISGACCVQPPMRMWETKTSVQNSFFGIYNQAIGSNVKRKITKYVDILHNEYLIANQIDLTKILEKIKTLTDFDLHITIPTFILMSKDDPIVGERSIDYEGCQGNNNIILGVTEHGGHMGYFDSFYSTQQWFVKPIFEFLNALKE